MNEGNTQPVSRGFLHLMLLLLALSSPRAPRIIEGLKSPVTTGSEGAGVRKRRSGRAGQRAQGAEVLKGETNGFQGAKTKVKGGKRREEKLGGG